MSSATFTWYSDAAAIAASAMPEEVEEGVPRIGGIDVVVSRFRLLLLLLLLFDDDDDSEEEE